MKRATPELKRIDSKEKIESNLLVWQLERALLLALKECGTLNTMQYRYAEENIKKKHGNHIIKPIAGGMCD